MWTNLKGEIMSTINNTPEIVIDAITDYLLYLRADDTENNTNFSGQFNTDDPVPAIKIDYIKKAGIYTMLAVYSQAKSLIYNEEPLSDELKENILQCFSLLLVTLIDDDHALAILSRYKRDGGFGPLHRVLDEDIKRVPEIKLFYSNILNSFDSFKQLVINDDFESDIK